MTHLSDGSVMQDGMGFFPRGGGAHKVPFPVLGVVRHVYYLDDEGNAAGEVVVCDVHVPLFGQDLYRVPFLSHKSSCDNFVEYSPRPSTQNVAKKGEDKGELDSLRVDPTLVDGDQVVVLFLNGNVQSPVIVASVPSYHTRLGGLAPYPRGSREDGDRYRIRINGMDVHIDKEGNLNIRSTKTLDTIPPNKRIHIDLGVEKDDPDVPEAQKQRIEVLVDNAEGAPKVAITVTDPDEKAHTLVVDGATKAVRAQATDADGKTHSLELDGTAKAVKVTAIDGDGKAHVLTLDAAGKKASLASAEQSLAIDGAGEKATVTTKRLNLGSEGSDEPLVLGLITKTYLEALHDQLDKIVGILTTGDHALSTSPGNPTAPNPAKAPDLKAIKDALDDLKKNTIANKKFLSDLSYTEKGGG